MSLRLMPSPTQPTGHDSRLLARVQAEAAMQHATIGEQLRLTAMSTDAMAHFWLDFMRYWAQHVQDTGLPAPQREHHLITAAAACLNWLDAQRLAVPTGPESVRGTLEPAPPVLLG